MEFSLWGRGFALTHQINDVKTIDRSSRSNCMNFHYPHTHVRLDKELAPIKVEDYGACRWAAFAVRTGTVHTSGETLGSDLVGRTVNICLRELGRIWVWKVPRYKVFCKWPVTRSRIVSFNGQKPPSFASPTFHLGTGFPSSQTKEALPPQRLVCCFGGNRK